MKGLLAEMELFFSWRRECHGGISDTRQHKRKQSRITISWIFSLRHKEMSEFLKMNCCFVIFCYNFALLVVCIYTKNATASPFGQKTGPCQPFNNSMVEDILHAGPFCTSETWLCKEEKLNVTGSAKPGAGNPDQDVNPEVKVQRHQAANIPPMWATASQHYLLQICASLE